MSTVQFARIREQGVTFAIVVVKDHIIDNRSQADEAVSAWTLEFGCPTILLGAQRHKLYGRPDVVRFMSNVSINRIPWRQTHLAA
jgi:hypothetical protein